MKLSKDVYHLLYGLKYESSIFKPLCDAMRSLVDCIIIYQHAERALMFNLDFVKDKMTL